MEAKNGENVSDANKIRKIAEIFDKVDAENGSDNDEVQRDLRKIADKIEKYEEEINNRPQPAIEGATDNCFVSVEEIVSNVTKPVAVTMYLRACGGDYESDYWYFSPVQRNEHNSHSRLVIKRSDIILLEPLDGVFK